MKSRLRNMVPLVTIVGMFFLKTHATKIDLGDLSDSIPAHDSPMEEENQSYHGPLKRLSGFVRIGRQGNFIRIGRHNGRFVRIGKDDKWSRARGEDADKHAGQHSESSTARVMHWYPIHHRFIRIGRPNMNGESAMRYGGSSDNSEESHSRNKKSNFVRIGRDGLPDIPSSFSLESDILENSDIPMNEVKRMPGFVRIGKGVFDVTPGQPARSGINTKRMPGFVRIGKDVFDGSESLGEPLGSDFPKRMPGFVRIGKDIFDASGKSLESGIINKRMPGFVRIGKDSLDAQEQPVGLGVNKRMPGFVRIGKDTVDAQEQPMRSGVINKRMSGFVRIGKGTFDAPEKPVRSEFSKRMPGFVRIGKDIFDNQGQTIGSGVSNKRMSGFVRIGKSPEPYSGIFVDPLDTDYSHSNDKKASNFVRIGKTPTAAQGKPLINDDNADGDDFEEDSNGDDNEDNTRSEKDNAATFVGLENDSEKNDGERSLGVFTKNGIDSSLNRAAADEGVKKVNKRGGPDYFHNLVSKRSHKNIKRLSNFINNKGAGPSIDNGRFQHFRQLKRSASMIALEDPDADRPRNTVGRRSAFVRIGKIPSSAFVRIGKNFDRVLEMPISNNRKYHHHYRRGHSSFVRIG